MQQYISIVVLLSRLSLISWFAASLATPRRPYAMAFSMAHPYNPARIPLSPRLGRTRKQNLKPRHEAGHEPHVPSASKHGRTQGKCSSSRIAVLPSTDFLPPGPMPMPSVLAFGYGCSPWVFCRGTADALAKGSADEGCCHVSHYEKENGRHCYPQLHCCCALPVSCWAPWPCCS